MNKDSRKIRTYIKIIDFLRESNKREFYPTVTDIVERLEKSGSEFNTSVRSVQRHLKDLHNEFTVSIDKKGKQGGYEIIMEDTPDFDEIYASLMLSEKAGYFKEVIAKPKESLQYICFDGKQFTGHQHIETIVDAIAQSKVIKFIYKKFDGGVKERKVKPYLLKEYNNRWYLVGEDTDSGQDRSFGLDRMLKIELTDEQFNNTEAAEVKDRFEKIIGISDPHRPLDEVVLKVDDNLIGYFRTYPWHKSAKFEQNVNGEQIVKLFVKVNYELKQLILMNHKFIQVLRPTHLAESIRTILTKSLEKYD